MTAVSLGGPGPRPTNSAKGGAREAHGERRRQRRRFSSLTLRILAPNVLALAILVAGVLYLDQYRGFSSPTSSIVTNLIVRTVEPVLRSAAEMYLLGNASENLATLLSFRAGRAGCAAQIPAIARRRRLCH